MKKTPQATIRSDFTTFPAPGAKKVGISGYPFCIIFIEIHICFFYFSGFGRNRTRNDWKTDPSLRKERIR